MKLAVVAHLWFSSPPGSFAPVLCLRLAGPAAKHE
jgi:hypothetical protein